MGYFCHNEYPYGEIHLVFAISLILKSLIRLSDIDWFIVLLYEFLDLKFFGIMVNSFNVILYKNE